MERRERTCRNRRARRRIGGLLFGVWLTGLAASGACAQSLFVDRTALIDVHQGSSLDGTVWALGTGGYELSDATPIYLRHWYTTQRPNVSASWLTEIRPDFGVTWRFQTGEHGDKYHINPALNLGIIMVDQLSAQSTLSFTANGVIGGWLKESTCQADYGAIGSGIQTVNCRLAASELPPAETLKYLANVPPPDWLVLGVRLAFRF